MRLFLRKLWTFVHPYRGRLYLGLLCGIISASMNGLLIITLKWVLEVVFPGSSKHTLGEQLAKAPEFVQHGFAILKAHVPALQPPLSPTGQILVVCVIPLIMFVRQLFGYLNVYLMNWSAVRAIVDLRTTLFDRMQNMPLSFFSQARTGDLMSRITSDAQALYGIIATSIPSMIKDPITVVATLFVLLLPKEQRVLTLVSMVVLPVCIVPILIYGQKVRKSARAVQSRLSDLAVLMHESFTGNRVVKAYNLEPVVLQQFRDTTRKFISHVMKVVRSNELPSQLTEFLGGIAITLVLIYVIVFLSGKSDVTDFFTFIFGIVLMYQPIKSLAKLHNQLHQARAASERIFELLDLKSTMTDPPNPVPINAANCDIHFEQVDFDYGEKPVLRGINLTVKAGQLVALVGSSGSGKTTLVNLLPRFYDPQHGTVRIGATNIRDVAIAELRRQIALVTQDTILFYDTISRNIGLGRPGATATEIEAAARHANAHEFILQKPQGYDTLVGEKGIQLSGGQRQRIAIARAILKDAPILILDEATSSLDTESERIVQNALEELMTGRTTICIAHRLSTIQKADVIVVFSEGKIVESGTHAELIERNGVYRRLYELQFQN